MIVIFLSSKRMGKLKTVNTAAAYTSLIFCIWFFARRRTYSLSTPAFLYALISLWIAVVIGVTFSCDYGWLLYRSRCYWRSVGEISGNNARGACRLRGAFLASVKDSGVQAFLQSRGTVNFNIFAMQSNILTCLLLHTNNDQVG